MKKSTAIALLGGTVPLAAEAVGISYQAVDKWPDELPKRISDRVLGAYARLNIPAVNQAVAQAQLAQPPADTPAPKESARA